MKAAMAYGRNLTELKESWIHIKDVIGDKLKYLKSPPPLKEF